jgi:hypothetical protein
VREAAVTLGETRATPGKIPIGYAATCTETLSPL